MEKFIEKEAFLLENDINERAITHKLGEYLSGIFLPKYSVDCEYNKMQAASQEEFVKKALHLDIKNIKSSNPD